MRSSILLLLCLPLVAQEAIPAPGQAASHVSCTMQPVVNAAVAWRKAAIEDMKYLWLSPESDAAKTEHEQCIQQLLDAVAAIGSI